MWFWSIFNNQSIIKSWYRGSSQAGTGHWLGQYLHFFLALVCCLPFIKTKLPGPIYHHGTEIERANNAASTRNRLLKRGCGKKMYSYLYSNLESIFVLFTTLKAWCPPPNPSPTFYTDESHELWVKRFWSLWRLTPTVVTSGGNCTPKCLNTIQFEEK